MRKLFILAIAVLGTSFAQAQNFGFAIDNVVYNIDTEGELTYTIFGGSKSIGYDLYSGKIEKIGSTRISYDLYSGKVEKVGSVRISYDLYSGKVEKIGGMSIGYDLYSGNVDGVRGQIN